MSVVFDPQPTIKDFDAGTARIDFTVASNGLTEGVPEASFADAIVLPIAQYDAMSIDDIKAMMQARFDGYLAAIAPPPDAPGSEDQGGSI